MTSAGKTYTMFGIQPSDSGLIQMIANDLFVSDKITEFSDKNDRFSIKFSYLEIYNE